MHEWGTRVAGSEENLFVGAPHEGVVLVVLLELDVTVSVKGPLSNLLEIVVTCLRFKPKTFLNLIVDMGAQEARGIGHVCAGSARIDECNVAVKNNGDRDHAWGSQQVEVLLLNNFIYRIKVKKFE